MTIQFCNLITRYLYSDKMSIKQNTNFGQHAADQLLSGDIVEWSRWCTERESWVVHYGIILEIKNKIVSNRRVSMATVIPIEGGGVEKEFFTLSLRLVSRGDDGRGISHES